MQCGMWHRALSRLASRQYILGKCHHTDSRQHGKRTVWLWQTDGRTDRLTEMPHSAVCTSVASYDSHSIPLSFRIVPQQQYANIQPNGRTRTTTTIHVNFTVSGIRWRRIANVKAQPYDTLSTIPDMYHTLTTAKNMHRTATCRQLHKTCTIPRHTDNCIRHL